VALEHLYDVSGRFGFSGTIRWPALIILLRRSRLILRGINRFRKYEALLALAAALSWS
jgi:hypothetical protein